MLVNDWFVVKASTTAWLRAKNNGRLWDNTEALATQSCLLLSENADTIPLGTLMCTLYLKAEKTLSVIYLTPSYTILHHLTPPQAKDAKVSPTTSTDFNIFNSLGRARPLPPCPSRLRCPAADFGGRDSQFDLWPKPGNDMQWRHIWQIYGLKLSCQWTRKILHNHAKSAFVCFQW